MPGRKRQGNNPKRRVAPGGAISSEVRGNLARARYVGSAHHKSRPADYGFIPPVNPRPGKSLCDDIRIITRQEAIRLFHSAIHLEMMSSYLMNGLPKFVWAVDSDGEAYESKLGDDGFSYHGYRLRRDDPFRENVISEWRKRG